MYFIDCPKWDVIVVLIYGHSSDKMTWKMKVWEIAWEIGYGAPFVTSILLLTVSMKSMKKYEV